MSIYHTSKTILTDPVWSTCLPCTSIIPGGFGHSVTEPNLGPLTHTVNPIYWHQLWWAKCSINCRTPSRENGWLMLKRPKLPKGFQGRDFKGKLKERVAECLISSWIFFWLVGGEVTGWYLASYQHQPFGFDWSGFYLYVVITFFTWWGF